MGLMFAPYLRNVCCLCGSHENLSGEHKIKASALRSEFRDKQMVIGRFGDEKIYRSAQSSKSKFFHFRSKVCKNCNNNLTQPADRAFDHLHEKVGNALSPAIDPKNLFNTYYPKNSSNYLNVFRYFAKILCCQMADAEAPRRMIMSKFAIGQSDINPIWLNIDQDWTYQQNCKFMGHHQYASHGGLIVYGTKKGTALTGFHSTLTIGKVRYTFFSRLSWPERLELRILHREFYKRCRNEVDEALAHPMSTEQFMSLGITPEHTGEKRQPHDSSCATDK